MVIKQKASAALLLMVGQETKPAIPEKVNAGIPFEQAIDDICGEGTAEFMLSEQALCSGEQESFEDTGIVYDGDKISQGVVGELLYSAHG